jgi:hypothetical protein
MYRKYEVKPEWTQQALVVYGGLIAIGVVIIQGLLGMPSLDLPSLISVVSFAVAIHLLATLVLINHSQASYRFASYPLYLSLAVILGEGCAFLGILAAIWHLSWIAGILLSISGLAGLLIYSFYSRQLQRDNPEALPVPEQEISQPESD